MKKSVGLALGAGGFRGLAHIGILKIFDKNNIKISHISGASIGAVISCLYASGMNGIEIERFILDFLRNPPFYLSINPIIFFLEFIRISLKRIGLLPSNQNTPEGIIQGRKINRYLQGIFKDMSYNQLKIPTATATTDLLTGETIAFVSEDLTVKVETLEETIFFTDCKIIDGLMGSISIPGIFKPYCYQDRILIDGGVKNSVPVDLISLFAPDIVIGVDLGFNYQNETRITDPLSVATQALDIMGSEVTKLNLERYADIVICPKLDKIELKDFKTITSAIKSGEIAAEAVLTDIYK